MTVDTNQIQRLRAEQAAIEQDSEQARARYNEVCHLFRLLSFKLLIQIFSNSHIMKNGYQAASSMFNSKSA